VLARWVDGGADPPSAAGPLGSVSAPTAVGEAGGDTPVLDPEIVARLERLSLAAGEDLIGQLADVFLVDADIRMLALRDALAGNDAATIVRCAHSMIGASGNIGARSLAAMWGSLEADGAGGDLIGCSVRLDALQAELERVRSALESRTTVA